MASLEMFTSFDHKGDNLLLSKLKALILDIIHNIEVVDLLIEKGTNDPADWSWHKQLKYYMDPRTKMARVGMCDAMFDYTYEY
jgi:dynein heavy chain 2, cytosolic